MSAPAPGTPVEHCAHRTVTHTHGTIGGYTTCWCRCDTCRKAVSRARNIERAEREHTGPRRMDAAAARERLHELVHQHGLTLDQVATITGLSDNTLAMISSGRRKLVHRTTHDALMAAKPTPAGTRVPRRGTLRRLHALHAIGWTAGDIARAAGVHRWAVTNLTVKHHPDTRGWVRRELAEAIAAAYDTLAWTTPTPSPWATTARNRAAARGWAPPAAWDDIDTDAHPQPWQVAPTSGRSDGRLHVDDLEWMVRTGATLDEATARTGRKAQTLRDFLTTHGRTDLWERLRENHAPPRAA